MNRNGRMSPDPGDGFELFGLGLVGHLDSNILENRDDEKLINRAISDRFQEFWDNDPSSFSFLDEMKIDNKSAVHQLERLAELSVQEVKHPSRAKKFGDAMAILVGVTSSYVYYGPTAKATKNKNTASSTGAIFATIFTNANLNAFFNQDAVRSLRFLRDPLTGKLSVPKLTLFAGIFISFASSFAFAFLDLTDPDPISAAYPTLKWINFFFQIFNYTAQHYFGLIAAINMVHDLKCCARATPESLELHAKTIEALESSLSILSNLFFKKQINVNIFYRAVILEYKHNILFNLDSSSPSEISAKKLVGFVMTHQETKKFGVMIPRQGFRKHCYSITKGLIQAAGLGIQVVGNIGYGKSTFNGFDGLGMFSFAASVALASGSMAPVLLLSFILSWDNVNKIGSMIAKVVTAIRQRNLDLLLDEIPLSIKKTPWFSLISGALLTTIGCFSYFTALRLLDQAIYGDSENPPEFGFMDPHQEWKRVYDGITIFAAVFFNCFPIPEVQAAFSTWYLQYFKGTPEDKQQLEVLSVMETWVARAKRIPPSAFVSEVKENKEEQFTLTLPESDRGIPAPPPPKQRLCIRLTQSFCGFWKKCFSDSSQQEATSGYRLMERSLQ